MNLQVGVKALLKNKEGKYLLLLRNPSFYPAISHPCWDIIGGRITPGTSLLENLKREVFEETQLELQGELALINAVDIIKPAQDLHVVRLTYLGHLDGQVVPLAAEVADYKWLTIDEVRQMPGLDKYTKELLNKVEIA